MGTLDSAPQGRHDQLLDYACAGRALPGQAVSGDACLVRPFPDGVLLAVIDGLGHGAGAAEASRTAIVTLEAADDDASVAALLERCHARMLGTRGAVMTLATLRASDDTMAWSGIGNVDAVLLRRPGAAIHEDMALICRGGVVGYRMPAPRVTLVPLFRGDLLIFATDGISSRFVEGVDRMASTDEIAEKLLACYGKPTDDALVLVARWLGAPGVAGQGIE
ncbi:MAG: SpoIIE family protein phosphatase [Telluria sp.]|nr:SpoIIE family protein phosphatase [Telluria sp.]